MAKGLLQHMWSRPHCEWGMLLTFKRQTSTAEAVSEYICLNYNLAKIMIIHLNQTQVYYDFVSKPR